MHSRRLFVGLLGLAAGSMGDRFVLEERGAVDVKGKGAMQTWWLVAEPGAIERSQKKFIGPVPAERG